jgi:Domain of unknown function (DUF4304)
LGSNGFARRGQNFTCESLECWGCINFQKSRYSAAEEKLFTINLAIAAKRILAYEGKEIDSCPPAYACHWTIRIGRLMPDRNDNWWTLSKETSFVAVEAEVQMTLSELAIPTVKDHLTEKGLLELWGSKVPDAFEYPMLKNKSVLLALDGSFDEIPATFRRILEICRGSSAKKGAEEHIARLKKHFSIPESV